jgi:hypothetical protein
MGTGGAEATMKLWLYHHRATVKGVYCVLIFMLVLILEILKAGLS